MENNAAFIAFLVLQMFGFCGGIILLVTALASSSVGRHPTWFSFIFSWVLSAGSYCLLLFSGNSYNGNPPQALCLTQAALIYAAPPLTAATTVALVTQMYCTIKNQISPVEVRPCRGFAMILIGIPYLLHAGMCLGCVSVSLANPRIVQRVPNAFYCNLTIRVPSRISSICVAMLLGVTVGIQGLALWTLRGNWGMAKGSIIRVCAFSFVGILAAVLGIIFASVQTRLPVLSLALACIPVAVVLIFGTQDDILQAWMLWRLRTSSPVTDSRIHLNPL